MIFWTRFKQSGLVLDNKQSLAEVLHIFLVTEGGRKRLLGSSSSEKKNKYHKEIMNKQCSKLKVGKWMPNVLISHYTGIVIIRIAQLIIFQVHEMAGPAQCKMEPMDVQPVEAFKPRKPTDALTYLAKRQNFNIPKESYQKEGSDYLATVKVNNIVYSGRGWDTESSFEKVAVLILYGEFNQDATDLYNYFLSKKKGDSRFNLKDLEVREEIKVLRAKSLVKTAMVSPFRPDDESKSPTSNRENVVNSSSSSATSMAQKREHSVAPDRNNSAKKQCLETKQPSQCESSTSSREEHIQQENEKLRQEIAHYEAELLIAKKEKELQEKHLDTLVKVERFIINQRICVPVVEKFENLDEREKELKEFLEKQGVQFYPRDVSFDSVPNGFAKFYSTVEVRLQNEESPLLTFAGKGESAKEALVHALVVVADYVKRSNAFSQKLLGPSEDVFGRLVKVLKYKSMDKVPFKVKTNSVFNLHEASLFHAGQNFKSVYSNNPKEAKVDVSKKVLRSMNYILYGDAINIRLEI